MKYINEKELRQEIYECVPFCIDSEIKYYDTIFIDGDMYPVFIFDFDLVYGICSKYNNYMEIFPVVFLR